MTQLYYQVYITYQLHFPAIAVVAIIRSDTIYRRNYIDIKQNIYHYWCR